jgi:hypothetical protein
MFDNRASYFCLSYPSEECLLALYFRQKATDRLRSRYEFASVIQSDKFQLGFVGRRPQRWSSPELTSL